MGFASTLMFYRPQNPPRIMCRDLAAFLQKFLQLGLLEHDGTRGGSLSVKYGEAIDVDDADPTPLVPTATEGIFITDDIDWDLQQYSHPLRKTIEVLNATDRGIYRAYIKLGGPTSEIFNALHREACAENDVEFAPDSWSLQIMPIETGQDGDFLVGWIAVGISGNGYPYPWTLRELVNKAEAIPVIRQLMQLCSETWPVEPGTPNARIQAARRELEEYWPYDRFDLPWDWYWGMQGLI